MGLARLGLELMGWKNLQPDQTEYLAQYPKAVMIFPHTSYYEFFLYLFYIADSELLRRRCRVLISPIHTKRFQWLLKHVGSVEATPREIRNGGAVDRICSQLEQLPEFLFVVSPKGSMARHHDWRKGFYAIARKLKCPVIPAGFDFEKKCFVIKPAFSVSRMSFRQACAHGKAQLKDIIPCHPEMAEYPLGPYNPNRLGLMSGQRWMIFWLLVLVVVVVVITASYWLWKKRSRAKNSAA